MVADGVFHFQAAVRRDPAVERWLRAQQPELRAIARRWVAQLRRCGRDTRELMHDAGATACVGDAAFAYVAVYRTHVNVGFYFGALLPDPAHLLEGTGHRGRHVKVRPGSDVDEAALSALDRAAYDGMRRTLAAP